MDALDTSRKFVIETVHNPSQSAPVLALAAKLNEALKKLTGSSGNGHAALPDFDQPNALFLLAWQDDEAVGCGALRPMSDDVCEIKRMFSLRSRCGIGKAVLAALEAGATEKGYREIRLETRRINITAVEFYKAHGYAVIENYGVYRGRDEAVCFFKTLH